MSDIAEIWRPKTGAQEIVRPGSAVLPVPWWRRVLSVLGFSQATRPVPPLVLAINTDVDSWSADDLQRLATDRPVVLFGWRSGTDAESARPFKALSACGYGAFVWRLGPRAVHAGAGPCSNEMISKLLAQCCVRHGLGEDFEVIAIHSRAPITTDNLAALVQAIPEPAALAAYGTYTR